MGKLCTVPALLVISAITQCLNLEALPAAEEAFLARTIPGQGQPSTQARLRKFADAALITSAELDRSPADLLAKLRKDLLFIGRRFRSRSSDENLTSVLKSANNLVCQAGHRLRRKEADETLGFA